MLSRRLIVAVSFFTVMALSFVMVFVFYRTASPHPWPESYDSIFTFTVDDPGSGFDGEISGAPIYIDEIDYPAINVTQSSLGIDGDYLYIRLDYAAVIPPFQAMISAEGSIEEQIVTRQCTTIAFNTDGDVNTGSERGADVLLTVQYSYGNETDVYGAYDFNGSEGASLDGEIGAGGMEYDYAILRYNILECSQYLSSGVTVSVELWSEAESDLYNRFTYEEIVPVEWVIP
ncbi:hypothetical protein ACFLXN_01535 [Chloroflexota bacterium]